MSLRAGAVRGDRDGPLPLGFLVLGVSVAAALGAATVLRPITGMLCYRLASSTAAWAKPAW